MVPPAPGTFSITTVAPVLSVIFWPMVRANTSGLPPGVNGTMMRIGLLGYADSAHTGEAAKVASAIKNVDRFII
jgi:hypothetical protein